MLSKKKQLVVDNEALRKQMYAQNKELVETNNTFALLQQIVNLVLKSHYELEQLCTLITQSILQHSSFPFVAILVKEKNHNSLGLSGWSTIYKTNVNVKNFTIRNEKIKSWLESDSAAYKVDVNELDSSFVSDTLQLPLRVITSLKSEMPVISVMVVKLLAQKRLVGLAVFGLEKPKVELSSKDITFIFQISDTVGIALDSKLLFEENQTVLKKLQSSNVKLQALDETKDDFISMASHQLRTPLTSVKGYLSMVLEGDAGKLNDMQRKLLSQAFISSQRMVFLIADLLNVSRLKTGKFIIETKPTNLAEVVEDEIIQLNETAAGRSLQLKYKKPASFPVLMLDETKVRQVVMNFIDNAIYYTPPGGNIDVELHETAESVEFRVRDTGIGVPPSERHHLFTKFYRAGNARKARPDGTGLGLFMAKKVIVAQGGSIIFSSQEGKGSTFGFAFNKSKLLVEDSAPKASLKPSK